MKHIFAMLLLVSGSLFGQTEPTSSKGTISVNGTASTWVTPDMTLLNIQVSALKMSMNDATKSVADQSVAFIKILKQLGFQDSDIKTTDFSAYKNRIYRENGPIDSGYVVSQSLQVKFPYQQATLQKIIARFSESKDPVNYSISFYVSEALRDKTQGELQTQAVADARKKAQNLSSAAGVKLQKIKSIEYGAVASPMYGGMYKFAEASMADGANLSLSPQQQEISESVQISWWLE